MIILCGCTGWFYARIQKTSEGVLITFFKSSKYFTQGPSREGSVPVFLRKPIATCNFPGGVLPPRRLWIRAWVLGLCCPYTVQQKCFFSVKGSCYYDTTRFPLKISFCFHHRYIYSKNKKGHWWNNIENKDMRTSLV